MKKNMFLIYPVLAAILLSMLPYGSYAATISGTVYNMNLEKQENAIVGINTDPVQKYVAKNGTYEFNLNPGQYTIIAFKTNGDNLEIEQKIIIKEEGEYLLDLILFPSLKEEEELMETTDFGIDEKYFKTKEYDAYWITAMILLVFLIAAYIILKPRKKEERQATITETTGTDLAEKVVAFIKKEGGRTTQKEIRKQFPSSEAKISLVITELEKKGKAERIKKGRGNIIKLK